VKSWNTLARFLGFSYGLLLVLALCRLPIEAFWIRHSPLTHDWDSVITLTNSTVSIIQLPAVIYFGTVIQKKLRWSSISYMTALLLLFMSLSTIWSTNKTLTLSEINNLVFCFISMVAFFMFFELQSAVKIFFISLQIPITASFWAAHHRWGLERRELDGSFTGVWQGVFTNRNFLSTMCVLAALFGLSLLFNLRHRSDILTVIFLVPLTVLDIFVLYKTRAGTGQGALIVFLILEIFFFIVVKFSSGQLLQKPIRIKILTGALFSSIVGFLLICFFRANEISSYMGKSAGLSGRSTMWTSQINRLLDRPLFGWGWMSPFWTESFRAKLPIELSAVYWSHSTHLDFALGIGLLGLSFYMVWIFVGLHSLILGLNDPFGPEKLEIFLTLLTLLSFEALSKGFHYIFALTLVLPLTVSRERCNRESQN